MSTTDFTATAREPVSRVADALATSFAGRIIGPADDEYDQSRAVWNGMVDRRPELIAQCSGVADVIAAVDVAREHNLSVAVRGGGHSPAGNGMCDGGLVIDMSQMRSVRVDPVNRSVRAEGGATIGELDRETQTFGLAVPQGLVSETGIAGLTLGGGLGWLRRKHGLACDSLLSADVVTADGTLVTASDEHNPELFWGLRGGGGNFGIVTSFEFRAFPLGPDVHSVVTFHAWEHATEALRFFRDWESGTPDEVSTLAVLWHAPAIAEIPTEHHEQPVVTFVAMYAGDPVEGEHVLRPLREHGAPIADLSGTMPYLEMQRFFDEDYPAHEMRYYWKSAFLTGLTDDALDTLRALNEVKPSPESTIDIWQLGGAYGRVHTDDTAFGDRSSPFLMGIEANWHDAADDDTNIAWARQVHREMQRFSSGVEYFNFPGLFEAGDQGVRTAFGDHYERLVELKRRYDPSNLFRLNPNISPS